MKNYIIEYTGWNYGFDKIGHVMLFQKYAGMSLGEAKQTMDRIMRNEVQFVKIESLDSAKKLFTESIQMGAICNFINNPS